MSQQYPQQPYQPQQQPYQGPGGYLGGPAPYQPPPPPKKGMSGWAIAGITVGGIFVFMVVLGIAAGEDTSGKGAKPADTVAAVPQKPAVKAPDAKPADKPAEKKPAPAPAKDLSQADQFKAFVAKNGTATEKAAVKHVIKVQGADSKNDFFDSADIYTDYAGGLMGPHQGDGKLLASAFADWKTSKNGLVTVYDKDGEMLSNGNY